MANNLELYEATRKVPENAKKPIVGGRLKGKTDINPMWRIKTLTEQFGVCGVGWYYNVTNQWTEQQGEEVAAFVNIELFIKQDGEWSKPIFGTGGSMLATKEKNGVYVSDECYKMATTDALSVACKQLGFGADVYWDKDATKYSQPQREQSDINSILKKNGINEEFLCGLYKVKDIASLTPTMIDNIQLAQR